MKDDKPRTRIVRLLLRIVANPGRFTRRELAEHFEVSKRNIDGDIKILKNIPELDFKQEPPNWTCKILPDRSFKELQFLQPLTEEERAELSRIIDRSIGSSKRALYLKRKLESLYDFQKLGLRALRRPALEKIDNLEQAKREQRQVFLKNYRSNSSNAVKDRLVEPFHIDPELDTLQAFDHSRKDSMHFRLSRIERVKLKEDTWQYTHRHYIKSTDIFRIANNDQEYVHLRLNLFAYNLLIEQFPLAKSYVHPAADPGLYDFEAKVNANFLGLIHFIMGHASHLEVMSPERLKVLVCQQAQAIVDKNQ